MDVEGGLLDVERIRGGCTRRRIGSHIEYLPSAESTNEEAWKWLDRDNGDGLVILAEHQSAGRGRFGRTWHSPRGASVLCSVLLIDRSALLTAARLVLISAVAVHEAITRSCDVRPAIKWPNDLVVDGRKLAGILIESRTRVDGVGAFVVGIGINCLQQKGHFPPELAGCATSLEIESNSSVDRSAVVAAVLEELDLRLSAPGAVSDLRLKEEWLSRAELLGKPIRLRSRGKEYSGTVIDLDPTAALVVQLDVGGVRSFGAADTVLVGHDH